MDLNDNEISLLKQHIEGYGANRFFQGKASVIPDLERLAKERDKALYHYNQILKILKLEE